jgi:hypothetical protein
MDTTTSALDSVWPRAAHPVLAGAAPPVPGTWLVTRRRSILRIASGRGRHFPHYGALHLDSS